MKYTGPALMRRSVAGRRAGFHPAPGGLGVTFP